MTLEKQNKTKENLFGYIKSGVYVITCIALNKHYIGEGKNVTARLTAHKNKLRRGIHDNRSLQQDFDRFGEKGFLFQHLLFGASQPKDKRLDLETIILLTLPPELRYNVYANWRKREEVLNPFYGRSHTPEVRKRLSLANSGKTSSFKNQHQKNEVKKLISAMNTGRSSFERRKPVIIDGVYYESVSEAHAKTGYTRRIIREHCHDDRFKNFKWAK